MPPAVEAQSLNHWTTREFPGLIFFNIYFNLFVWLLQGEGNGNPPQYSCLENPVDRGAWRAAVHRVAQSRTRLK